MNKKALIFFGFPLMGFVCFLEAEKDEGAVERDEAVVG